MVKPIFPASAGFISVCKPLGSFLLSFFFSFFFSFSPTVRLLPIFSYACDLYGYMYHCACFVFLLFSDECFIDS